MNWRAALIIAFIVAAAGIGGAYILYDFGHSMAVME